MLEKKIKLLNQKREKDSLNKNKIPLVEFP